MQKKDHYWLILYDITDGRRLAKTAKCLTSYGWRIQKSIFESHADHNTIEELKYRLKKIIHPADSIIIIPVCENDRKKRIIIGQAGAYNPMEEDAIIC